MKNKLINLLKFVIRLFISGEELGQFKEPFRLFQEKDKFYRLEIITKLLFFIEFVLLFVDGYLWLDKSPTFNFWIFACHLSLCVSCLIYLIVFNLWIRDVLLDETYSSIIYYTILIFVGNLVLMIEHIDYANNSESSVFIIFIFSINLFLPLSDKGRWSLSLYFVFFQLYYLYKSELWLASYLSNLINSIIAFLLSIVLGTWHYRNFYINKYIANLELENRNAQLEGIMMEFEELSRVLSHDLKEPLRNIKSFSDLLSKKLKKLDKDNHEESDYLLNIGLAALKLKEVIDKLRDYVEISNAETTFAKTNVKVIALKCIDKIKKEELDSKYNIVLGNLDFYVYMSPPHLEMVLHHLLSNAINHSQSPSKSIRIFAEAKQDKLMVHVSDDGIGVEEEQQSKIFDLFYRKESRLDRDAGVGVGLSTCKKILNKYGCQISVNSAPSKGADFYFSLNPATNLNNIS